MPSRHALIYLLFLVVAGALALLDPRVTYSAPSFEHEHVPPEALAALRDGRYMRASLILREYLAAQPDTSAAAILLTAQADAGWGDWERVRQLLQGRNWLDVVQAGYGWSLLGRSQLELGDWRASGESYARFLTVTHEAGSRARGLAQLQRARALAEQRRFSDAVQAFDTAAALLPQIADWIQVFAASAAAGAADTAAVRQRLAGVDTGLASEWAWRTEVRARRAAGDRAGAIAAAERAIDRVRSDARRAAAWTLLGELRIERGDLRGARTAFIRAMNVAPASTAAIEAARAMAATTGLSAEDRLLIGTVYLRHGNTARGIEAIRDYLASGRGTPAARARLAYEVASAQFHAGDYAPAEASLLALGAGVADRAVASDALHDAARAQYRDGRHDDARETLLRVVRDFDDQPAAARAAFLLADLDHDLLQLERAIEFYRRSIQIAPASDQAALAHMRIAGIAFAQHRFADALQEMEDYRSTHRAGRNYQQATFWSAQALLRLGRTAEARSRLVEAGNLDPFSYYGGLADELLGDVVWLNRLEHAPPASDRYVAQVDAALARIDLLREIGWNDAATFEMERVLSHFARFDGALYTLAETLNERGFTTSGVALGREIYRREGAWNLRLLRIVYPFPFRNIITAEALERNVDPFLAVALIRQESMFNAAARSPAGALGLMQVMPRTGQALARSLGVPRFRPELLTQPELNVHFGTAYLADQLRAYGNRVDVVLAAYNAGPGRVSRWQQFPEFADRLLFAERIPFDETRSYVRIVQNNRRIYAAIYAAQQPGDQPAP
jgi:soluble lytic murein transglycosylase